MEQKTDEQTKKKTRWFQIHLSTAFVMMVVAGALIWANLRILSIDYDCTYLTGTLRCESQCSMGWPFNFVTLYREETKSVQSPNDSVPNSWLTDWSLSDFWHASNMGTRRVLYPYVIALDFIAVLLLETVICLFMEHRIKSQG